MLAGAGKELFWYSEQSPMENHHLAATFTLMRVRGMSCLGGGGAVGGEGEGAERGEEGRAGCCGQRGRPSFTVTGPCAHGEPLPCSHLHDHEGKGQKVGHVGSKDEGQDVGLPVCVCGRWGHLSRGARGGECSDAHQGEGRVAAGGEAPRLAPCACGRASNSSARFKGNCVFRVRGLLLWALMRRHGPSRARQRRRGLGKGDGGGKGGGRGDA